MLLEIKNYLQQHRRASLLTLSKLFAIEVEPLRAILALLVRKGQVRVCTKTTKCGTQCQQCGELVTEIYEWSA